MMNAPEIFTEEKRRLLHKYNVATPRYTSYPTVPYWETSPTESQWKLLLRESLVTSQAAGTGAAIYMHIPFCERLCTFCGCNTRITKNHSVAMPYIETILAEWRLYQQHMDLGSPWLVSELHLGGGTPTFLSVKELSHLLVPVLDSIKRHDHAEFSLEIDPRVTTREQLALLRELGFSRVSLGVQDFDPTVQEVVNRIQPYEMVADIVGICRELGYTSVNFDLIYGLPKQNTASVEDTFKKVLQLKPDRIAYYAYAHVPWIKPSHRKFTEEDLPKPDIKRRLYEIGREMLEDQGYGEVGMDHFALPTDSLWKACERHTMHRNFMGYTSQHVDPLVGLGVSAISDSWTAFMQNEKTIEAYQAKIREEKFPILRGHVLTGEDLSVRRHILNLMTKFATDWTDETDSEALVYLEASKNRLRELEQDGLVEFGDKSIQIKDKGRPFIRNIGMAIDARLVRKAPGTSLFSQSI